MLLIRIAERDGEIKVIDISKHVQPDDDDDLYRLICAGVSCVATGLCNVLDQLCPECCEISFDSDEGDPDQPNFISIRAVKASPELQTILKTGKIQLQCAWESYSQYIDYKITEV